MNTIALKKADGVVKMTVLADENGKPVRLSKSEATLKALEIEGATVSKDNFGGRSVFDKKGKFVKAVYDFYFVRINAAR